MSIRAKTTSSGSRMFTDVLDMDVAADDRVGRNLGNHDGHNDLLVGMKSVRVWGTLGWHDIRQRYRRSVIGPFWFTLSTAIMVVVLGGVGQLAGTVCAALGLGVLNKLLEGFAGAVLAKIAVLVIIIVFIQKRPQGLFAVRGRFVEN